MIGRTGAASMGAAGRPGLGGPVVSLVAGTAFCLSSEDGQVRRGTDAGLYVEDVRVLDMLEVTVDGLEPVSLRLEVPDAASARFTAFVDVDAEEHDPSLVVERERSLGAEGAPRTADGVVVLEERITLRNHGRSARAVTVGVVAGTDFASVAEVRRARTPPFVGADVHTSRDGLLAVHLPRSPLATTVAVAPPPHRIEAGTQLVTRTVPAHGSAEVVVTVRLDGATAPDVPVPGAADAGWDARASRPPWQVPTVTCSDGRVSAWLRRSVRDLTALLQHDPAEPADRFCAAGIPWYQTLFGRDALWTARMTLPLGTSLAAGTLRTLARRQGMRHDAETDEAPGKIVHEVRHGVLRERAELPPQYYGSIDATLLFVVLLHDAWRWGMAEQEVRGLLPALHAALEWLERDADPDGGGLVAYLPSLEGGLVNQGWKDSVEGVARADGSAPPPPLALCEVQGYAFEAAHAAAALLEAFDEGDPDHWRAWAGRLGDTFRRRFWVRDAVGPYPALALDGTGAPLDPVASNMGHLLGTGLLTARESSAVATRLAMPGMDSGWGLRTLDTAMPGFNPLSYHCGSVWPHDTAIAVHGLARAGHDHVATALARGLVAAAGVFDGSLPELYGGEARRAGSSPLPYPAACRPQAWAAASAWHVLRSLLRLEVDVPGGQVHVDPVQPFPFEHLEVDGLHVAGGTLSLRVGRHVPAQVLSTPSGLAVSLRDRTSARV